MYFNRSRVLPAHNKNKSHMPQPSSLSMKRSKSNRKSLEMMGRRSERESRASTPTPMDINLPEIPKLQVLPNGQKPNFGNSSNKNHHHHNSIHHHHSNSSHTHTHNHNHNHNHNQINKNNDLNATQYKSYSRKRSTSGGKPSKRDKETDVDKRNRNIKRESYKKIDKTNIESTEDVTNQLKNLLINDNNSSRKKNNDNLKSNVTDVKNMNRVQNNPSPLTTFLTSPIITPETIPPQLKIENNYILGKTPLLPSIQQNTQAVNTDTTQKQQQQQQFSHKLLNDSKVVNNTPTSNNITSLPPLPHPAPAPASASNSTTSTMNNNNHPPLPIINGIVHSPSMQPLTSFQISNNVPPRPFGNNNMNYSITNVPLPMPPFMAPPPLISHQSPLNGPNILNSRDIYTNIKNIPVLPELILNEDIKKTSNKSNNTKVDTTTNNNINKQSKCTNKKTSHTFAGASFATDIPQECNLPKPSFL